MSFYHTLYETNNVDSLIVTEPSSFIFKDNPFVNYPIIDSNIAGVNKKNIMTEYRKQEKPVEKPYEFVYQSCCSLNVPASPEYKNLREVITPP